MKRISAILVCVLLVAAIAVTAFAAAPEMTITAAKTSVSRGETVDFTITLSEVANLRSAMIDLVYDKNVFEFVEGTCTVPGAALPDFFNGNGVFMLNSATTFSGQIFTFKMKVKDNAAFGTTTITGTPTVRDNNGPVAGATATTVNMTVVCNHVMDNGVVTTPATCEADGVKTFSCTVSGCTHKTTEAVAKLGHKWDNGTVTTAATCKAPGVKTFTCENGCGETKTEAIAQLPHTMDEGVQTKDTTCTEEGELTYTCSVCGAVETEAIVKLPHDFDEGKVTTPATTKQEGVKTYTCKDCGATETESIPKLKTPATDDNSMIVPFVLLLVLSATGVAITVVGKKRVVR